MCPVETGFKQVPELRETRGQKQLPLNVMLDVVAQLPDLELIEYFDYGEPFIHRDTVTFLREVRRMRPGRRIVTNTNGTVMTPEQIRAIAAEFALGPGRIFDRWRDRRELSAISRRRHLLKGLRKDEGTFRRLSNCRDTFQIFSRSARKCPDHLAIYSF